MIAMAAGKNWSGHIPGPNGLPGGYPVKFSVGRLDLDLPAQLAPHEAIAWNLSYEEESGLIVGSNGHATYTESCASGSRRSAARSLTDFTFATSRMRLAR